MQQKGRTEQILEELENMVNNGQSGFGPGKISLPKDDLLLMVHELSDTMKTELKQYREITDKRAKVLREAQQEADDIIYEAEQSASRIRVSGRKNGVAPVRVNTLPPEEQAALASADQIYAASLVYTDEMLTEIEDLINNTREQITACYEYAVNDLKAKCDLIAANRRELMEDLKALEREERYQQILEIGQLISQELYIARRKELGLDEQTERDEAAVQTKDEADTAAAAGPAIAGAGIAAGVAGTVPGAVRMASQTPRTEMPKTPVKEEPIEPAKEMEIRITTESDMLKAAEDEEEEIFSAIPVMEPMLHTKEEEKKEEKQISLKPIDENDQISVVEDLDAVPEPSTDPEIDAAVARAVAAAMEERVREENRKKREEELRKLAEEEKREGTVVQPLETMEEAPVYEPEIPISIPTPAEDFEIPLETDVPEPDEEAANFVAALLDEKKTQGMQDLQGERIDVSEITEQLEEERKKNNNVLAAMKRAARQAVSGYGLEEEEDEEDEEYEENELEASRSGKRDYSVNAEPVENEPEEETEEEDFGNDEDMKIAPDITPHHISAHEDNWTPASYSVADSDAVDPVVAMALEERKEERRFMQNANQTKPNTAIKYSPTTEIPTKEINAALAAQENPFGGYFK